MRTTALWGVSVGVAVLIAAVLAAGVWAAFEFGPSITPRQNLPDDVALLTETTWDRFVAAFPAQIGCLADVELDLVDDVAGGTARYVASERLILIEIPTSPRRYVESLAHELGHHIEASCDAELVIGAAIKEAQGIDPQLSWYGGEAWAARPTEQFAEAVVEYVTGDRFTHSDIIDVSAETFEVVEGWATGTD